MKRFLMLCFAFLYSFHIFVFPVFAVDVSEVVSGLIGSTDFWDFIKSTYRSTSNWWSNHIDGDENVCPDNTDTFNGPHDMEMKHTILDGVEGDFYICKYCGKAGKQIAAEAYDDYTEMLPATGIGNDGSLYWSPDFLEFVGIRSVRDNNRGIAFVYNEGVDRDSYYSLMGSNWRYNINWDKYILVCFPREDSSSLWCGRGLWFKFSGICPITGLYSMVVGTEAYEGYYFKTDDTMDTYSLTYSSIQSSGRVFGDKISYSYNNVSSDCYTFAQISLLLCPPVYKITPTSGLINTQSDTTYNINTRASSITGDYGIMGDNNQLTKIDQQIIVNETDNSVYNPVTDSTYDMSGWTYDYSTRSYNITYETVDQSTGDTTSNSMTVTYGDENITIIEGDNTYNVYYIVEALDDSGGGGGSGGNDTPSTPHRHDYVGTVTREPTCVDAGIQTFTCSCGDSYSRTIAPLGHDWQVKQQVMTEYDGDGHIVSQGYTIYKCSRCGEEYKIDATLDPPAVVDDDTTSLETLKSKFLTYLRSLPDMFGGFTDFVRDGFQYIPEEILFFIEFSFAAATVVLVYKLLRR